MVAFVPYNAVGIDSPRYVLRHWRQDFEVRRLYYETKVHKCKEGFFPHPLSLSRR